jgi:hypothetical protein
LHARSGRRRSGRTEPDRRAESLSSDQSKRDRARRSVRVSQQSCSGGGETMAGEPSQNTTRPILAIDARI